MPYLDILMTSQDDYGRRVAIKTIMILDGIYRTNADWLFWMDADTFINNEWLELSLDEYTNDIPEDKYWISTNYKALLTGKGHTTYFACISIIYYLLYTIYYSIYNILYT
jgi:hypothetical protein